MWFWLFCVSAALNILSFFYIRWLLTTVAVINEDVTSATNLLREFSGHLSSVYELETFYGDETLGSLMRHARELSNKLENIDLILNEEEEVAEEKTEEN